MDELDNFISNRLSQLVELDSACNSNQAGAVMIAAAIDELKLSIDDLRYTVRSSSIELSEKLENISINLPVSFKDPNRY